MPSTHSHIQALENLWNKRAKLTSKKLPPLGSEPRTLKVESSTTTNLTNSQPKMLKFAANPPTHLYTHPPGGGGDFAH